MADPSVPVLRQRRRLAATVESLGAEQWATASRCAGWSVQDVIAHLIGTNRFWALSIRSGLVGTPTRYLSSFDPVATPQLMVEGMRTLSHAEVLKEFVESIDDVAVDFPDMPIVIAHPSFPWQEEALSVATHKAQVYIDLSGWSPKYFPPILVQYANTLLRDKVMFGSDFPLITPERWLADMEKTGIRDEVKPAILKDNAVRFFRLDATG